MARSILVIGHSHIDAIRRAAVVRREADPLRPRTRTIYLHDPAFGGEMNAERTNFSDGVRAAILTQIERHDPIIASAIGGNAHAALVLIPRRRFDFVLSGDDSLPIAKEAELLSEDEVRAMLLEALEGDLRRLRLLRTLAGPFWHLQSPPPVRNSEWVRTHAEAFFTNQPDFHELGVAPAGVRYRAWRLACRIIREECDRLDCGYVSVPPNLCGAAGLLRPSQARDATHGNTHFGEEMIRALERAAGEVRVAQPS